jgi:hypothetical protein
MIVAVGCSCDGGVGGTVCDVTGVFGCVVDCDVVDATIGDCGVAVCAVVGLAACDVVDGVYGNGAIVDR